ncbi:MAG: hypothetical protein BRD38_04055 [Bacteroidetes bacterium QH_9_67_14]|nr:MAG: hypothetical protein BRD38_04055 [Bacteroidetes bacterium QH_9_67_14]
MVDTPLAVEILLGVAGIIITLVGPLYYLVLDIREDLGSAETERETLSDNNDTLGQEVHSMREEMQDMREEVKEIGVRAEYNQKHIHDLIIGHDEEDGGPLTSSPHHPTECPYGDGCPWHGGGA